MRVSNAGQYHHDTLLLVGADNVEGNEIRQSAMIRPFCTVPGIGAEKQGFWLPRPIPHSRRINSYHTSWIYY